MKTVSRYSKCTKTIVHFGTKTIEPKAMPKKTKRPKKNKSWEFFYIKEDWKLMT